MLEKFGDTALVDAMSELYDLPGHLIRRLQQIAVAVFANRMQEAGYDLTPVQFAAMVAIRDNPGLDQATLAGLIAYDRVTIGGVVDRLCQKELVGRETSTRDRRARILTISDKGDALLKAVTPWVQEVQNDIVDPLTDAERDALIATLQKLISAKNEHSRAPLRLPDPVSPLPPGKPRARKAPLVGS